MIAVSSVTPSLVPTRGGVLVELVGAGFQVDFDLSTTTAGRVPKPPPSMRISVGGKRAERIFVISATRLMFTPPPGTPGTFVATVQNLDLSGAVIDSGTFTITRARPMLGTGDDARQSAVYRVLTALAILLRDQVIENVVIRTHTDYEDIDKRQAQLPVLIIANVKTPESRYYSENIEHTELRGDDVITLPTPRTVDIQATIIGQTETTGHLFNLQSATEDAIHKAIFLTISRDPTDPTSGERDYEIQCSEVPSAEDVLGASENNVIQFSLGVIIRCVDIDFDTNGAEPGKSVARPVDEIAIVQNEGGAIVPGVSQQNKE